eukprot:5888830-Amphidinium_carterae.1
MSLSEVSDDTQVVDNIVDLDKVDLKELWRRSLQHREIVELWDQNTVSAGNDSSDRSTEELNTGFATKDKLASAASEHLLRSKQQSEMRVQLGAVTR